MLESELIDEVIETAREKVVKLVRRYGGFTSDAALDPHMKRFSVEGIEGFISYLPSDHCVVVYGDPVCAKPFRGALAEAFQKHLDKEGKEAIYICASEAFAKWAIGKVSKLMLEFGEELAFNPQIDPRKMTGTHAQLVRRKVKRALKEGVEVEEFKMGDAVLQAEIEKVGRVWLDSRKGTQVHISSVYQFEDCFGKRWFYARQKGKVVGVITANRIEAEEGYLINHLMVPPKAPRGTSELLMVSVLETFRK